MAESSPPTPFGPTEVLVVALVFGILAGGAFYFGAEEPDAAWVTTVGYVLAAVSSVLFLIGGVGYGVLMALRVHDGEKTR